jgi:two-component system, NtrC family, nitrogen regulation sensor histidine kinase NtrY
MIFLKGINKIKIFGYFFAGMFLIFLAGILRGYFSIQDRPENITKKFALVLHQKEKLLSHSIEKMKGVSFQKKNPNRIELESEFQEMYKKNGILLFVYENDSLVYWSSNSASCPEKLNGNFVQDTDYFEKQKNGWYEVIRKKDDSKVYIGQILIKQKYLFENEYLRNNFEKGFRVTEGTEIDIHYGTNPILTAGGRFLFCLKIPPNPDLSQAQVFILFLLYLAGFILLLVSLYKLYCHLEHLFPSRVLFLLSLFIDVILIRIFQFYFHLPTVLYNSKLFGPESFSSSFLLPSLGDFLVNSILLLFVSYVFFRHYPGFLKTQKRNKTIRITVSVFLFFIILTGFFASVEIIHDLVVNSTIPFNLQDISSLDFLSAVGCFIISAVFLSFFLIAIRLFQSFFNLSEIGDIHNKERIRITGISLSRIVLYLIFFSITGTFILNHFNDSIEKEKRKLLALKLGTDRDAMAEMMFSKTEQQILSDSLLRNIISDSIRPNTEELEDSLEKHLQNNYFRGYWNNYTFQVTLCSGIKTLRVQPYNYFINCKKYFQNIINEVGKPTQSRYLYFLDYGYGYKNYLAVIPVMTGQKKPMFGQNAYIEISSKLIFKDIGYPELLIDKKEGQIPDLSDYSYAYYRNGKLIHRVGNVQYSLELGRAVDQHHTLAHYYSQEGYSHYCYPIDKGNVLIVSKKESSLLDRIAPFSYLFFFFTLFSIIFFMIIRFSDVLNISFLRLGDRLQLSMSGILVTSLLITGWLIVYYIINLNTAKNRENLSERTHSMLIELQHKIGNSADFSNLNKEELNEMLTEFSNVFFADVNLYSPDGKLIATSRPEIFEEGLSSGLMNREAFSKLNYIHNSYYFHKETIGENGYYSAYMPFFNEKNQLLAYLNLPYFARQDDLKKEISAFLVAFINVYVFLIIVGIFLALVVSNYISRPLRILASRISQLSYGKNNEKIEWKRRDEIGQLVDEYNRMIDELVKSAELLAKSERETAWREMARQVAHEIKNPLTPMKLSVQHLEKAWKDRPSDWDERLKRFTETMTEQIESLSAIASEFSDFAKMPVTKAESLDINEILENVKTLYQDTSQIRFEFRYDSRFPHKILGDKKQLLRVFTNLINNAIQAIGNNKDGMISIDLELDDKKYRLKISDSGEGISADLSDRIFQPNFTTKSGGMGMGLAIVKSIIQGLGGEIGFTSGKGSGTTFIIIFPALETDKA